MYLFKHFTRGILLLFILLAASNMSRDQTMSTKFLDIFVIFLIFCPIPHIYLYFSWTDTSVTRQQYDVYDVPYGRIQSISESELNCSHCLVLLSQEGTDVADCIASEFITTDYNCAIKLSLQSSIKYFEMLNQNKKNKNNINSKGKDSPKSPNLSVSPDDATTSSKNTFLVKPINDTEDGNHGTKEDSNGVTQSDTLYGMMAGEFYATFDYLTGEWILSGDTVNDHPVWHSLDKYGRRLKLFLYDDRSSRRWIVGHNTSSDEAFIHCPLRDKARYPEGVRTHPVEVMNGEWLYFDQVSKRWMALQHFRFSPSSKKRPRIQTLSLMNNTLINPGQMELTMSFTHWIEAGDALSGGAVLIHHEDGTLYRSLRAMDDSVLIEEDSMTFSVYLPSNDRFTVSLSADAVHSVPKDEENGNNLMGNILTLRTGSPTAVPADWNLVAAQCLEIAQSSWLVAMTQRESDGEMTRMDSMDSVEYALLISLLNSLLLLGTEAVELERNLQLMSQYLALQKEVIISRNESAHDEEEVQLLKSRYYLRLSQLNVLKAAAADDEVQRKKWMDKTLRICIKQFYAGNVSKQVLSQLHQNGHYCNLHTFYTNYGSMNAQDRVDWTAAIRLRWTVREYINRYSHDLSIFLDTEHRGFDSMKTRSEFASTFAPRYDILFGLRHLDDVRIDFARFGVVQLFNVLNRVETQWLNHYFIANRGRMKLKIKNDIISSLYLQELQNMVSYLVGSPVRGSCSMFLEFNGTNPDWKCEQSVDQQQFKNTKHRDQTFTLQITISIDDEGEDNIALPFPIMVHQRVLPHRQRTRRTVASGESYQVISGLGDGILFKGQHIHSAPFVSMQHSKDYVTMLFQYVFP